MASYNKVILIGNLTANPQIKYNPGGLAITTFTLAVNTRYSSKDSGQKEEVGFFDVVVFGKQAESCANYLSKGRTALVDGRLVHRRWETPEGVKKSKIEIVAARTQFLSPKGASAPQGQEETDIIDDLPLEEDIPF
jgi:single-strand DNA-binding protein